MGTALDRVTHHLGNGAQILCFVPNPPPEIVEALGLLERALKLIKEVNVEQEEK